MTDIRPYPLSNLHATSSSHHDALSDLLQHGALHGNVVDAAGQTVGGLSMETLARLAQA